MNPFQKNPKHASVLAERYLGLWLRPHELKGLQCVSMRPSGVSSFLYEWCFLASARDGATKVGSASGEVAEDRRKVGGAHPTGGC